MIRLTLVLVAVLAGLADGLFCAALSAAFRLPHVWPGAVVAALVTTAAFLVAFRNRTGAR